MDNVNKFRNFMNSYPIIFSDCLSDITIRKSLFYVVGVDLRRAKRRMTLQLTNYSAHWISSNLISLLPATYVGKH